LASACAFSHAGNANKTAARGLAIADPLLNSPALARLTQSPLAARDSDTNPRSPLARGRLAPWSIRCPPAMRDLLPPIARRQGELAGRVTRCFELHGYELVTLPVFEYAEVLGAARFARFG